MEDNRVTNVLRIVETRKEREETLTISVRICIVKCTISWHPRVFNLFRYIPIVAQDLVSCSTSDTCTDKNVKKIRKEASKYLIRTHVQGNFLVSPQNNTRTTTKRTHQYEYELRTCRSWQGGLTYRTRTA